MKKKRPYLFCLVLLFPFILSAQTDQIVVKKVPFINNTPISIHHFLQDTTGLLWLMSYDKMYVSDGEKINRVLMPYQADANRAVNGMMSFTRQDGHIYLGGDSLRIFNPFTRQIVQTIGLDAKYERDNRKPAFWMFLQGADNDFWAVMTTHQIDENNQLVKGNSVVYSKNGKPFQKVVNAPFFLYSQSVTARGKQLFIAKKDTVFQYNNDGDLVKTYSLPKVGSVPYTAKNQVATDGTIRFLHYIKNEKNGQLDRAIYELKPNESELNVLPFPELNTVSCLSFKEMGDYFWTTGEEMSLHKISLKDRTVTDYSKIILQQHPDISYFNSTILNVLEDKTGTIWVTTSNKEVLKIENSAGPFTRYLKERRQYPFCANGTCVIRGITADEQGNIYFAYDFGIYKIDTKTGKHKIFPIDLPTKVTTAYSLTYFNGKLYFNDFEIDVNTGKGRLLLDGESAGKRTHYINKQSGKMWFSDSKWDESIPIYEYDLDKKEVNTVKTIPNPRNPQNQVSQFHFSPTTNTLFMATLANGLCELDNQGNIRQFITAEATKTTTDSIISVYSIYEDDQQQLWIGHRSGLSRFDLKTRQFTPIAYKGNLSAKAVFSIQAENKTYCWLGTSSGIYRLNTQTGQLRNLQMFPSQSRKEFNRFATYQDNNGLLYFGSVEGLFTFNPKELIKASQLEERFPIRLSQLIYYDSQKDSIVSTSDNLLELSTIHVYPNQRYFSLDVFVPDFRDAEQNTYTWWLEGYDASWTKPSKSNIIRYDNLPVGKYTLHIRGGITADYYESSERQIQVIVHQAWYKSWWAWILYIALFLGLIYAIYRNQVRQQLDKLETNRLKELNLLKSRLYTNITHEFRTPLTVIMGISNNIKGHQKEKQLIQRNSQNLLQLINQLLDLSKLDSNTLKLNNTQGEIVNYLRYLTESFHSMAGDKNIQLTFYTEIQSLVMDYDEAKIQHIIYNLLNNAIKFTNEGGKVILHIRKVKQEEVNYLQLKISDTGIGISATDIPQIFDRFYQADASSTRTSGGTGIGLALTKELVEMMKCEISVESQLNVGTTFSIILPIKKQKNTPKINTTYERKEQLQKVETLISIPTILNNSATKPTLLLIEDNRDVATYIERLLAQDYQILTAVNGQIGIDKALEAIPDIIISDVMMPEKDGYEVCQYLKNDERTSHIPIILLTAKAMTADRIEGLKGGADAYLTKPFHKEELFIRLAQLIALRQALQKRYSTTPQLLSLNTNIQKSPSLEEVFLQKLVKVVEDRLDDTSLAVVHLCQAVNLSNMQVNRKLKALTGKTPSRFIRSIRLQKALELLKTTDLNISEIAYDVGFSDPNYFSRSFSEEFGYAPSVIRK